MREFDGICREEFDARAKVPFRNESASRDRNGKLKATDNAATEALSTQSTLGRKE
jgi:hypothetical protein